MGSDNAAAKRELHRRLKEQARRKRYNLVKQLFPETGPYRRELYPKHMEFFRAGSLHRERLFMAANRCVTPWTFIETESGPARALEALFGFAGSLRAKAGESECAVRPVDAHLVGIEPAFRVVLGSGRFFDCSRKHQVLTDEGWLSLGQLVSSANGLHWSHKTGDYQASCAGGGYLDGQQPLKSSSSDPIQPPSPSDAQTRNRLALSLEDAMARTPQHIRVCQRDGRPSSMDDRRCVAALSEQFLAAKTRSDVLPLSGRHRALQRFAIESGAHLQSGGAAQHHQDALRACDLQGSICRVVLGKPEGMRELSQDRQQSGTSAHRTQSVGVFGESADQLGIFYPSSMPRLVGGETVTAIVPIGYQPIIDAHIPEFNNYRAAGVYHHNCGKTVAGGTEQTYHMTGDYPDWWEGHQFEHPVQCLAAGDTSTTTRDIIQNKLLGGLWGTPEFGSGLLPGDTLGKPTPARGVANLYDELTVAHVSGGTSRLMLRSYEQGRKIFQGTEQHFIWLDEEVPKDVYDEALIRTMTTRGLVIMTFTPLSGLTPLVVDFLEAKHEQEPV